MSAYLADVNFVLALVVGNHPHSRSAVNWLEANAVPNSIRLCRVAQMGAIRLLTKASVMGVQALTGAEAWNRVEELLEDQRFTFVAEPLEIDTHWSAICKSLPTGAMAETDCYLAAFAISMGCPILTFDKGMRRFDQLQVTTPA